MYTGKGKGVKLWIINEKKAKKGALHNRPYLQNEKRYRKSDSIFEIYDKFSIEKVYTFFSISPLLHLQNWRHKWPKSNLT